MNALSFWFNCYGQDFSFQKYIVCQKSRSSLRGQSFYVPTEKYCRKEYNMYYMYYIYIYNMG